MLERLFNDTSIASRLDRLSTVAYVAASLLFVLSLRGLSTQETSRRGNLYGTIGMVIAVVMTALARLAPRAHVAQASLPAFGLLGTAIAIGCAVGGLLASRVAMTSMPELVAILHSFVGAAAVLVGWSTWLEAGGRFGSVDTAHLREIYVGVVVGAVTFTGSVVAFGKLRGTLSGKPLLLPGRHVLNLVMVGSCFVLGTMFVRAPLHQANVALLVTTGVAALLGVHLVTAIGGGDMPVVVSLLNSYSGWAAAAAGFMLSNDLLIITGALVGSSGAILSYIMCQAMNRSIWSVVFGGFGAEAPSGGRGAGTTPAGKVNDATAAQVAELLLAARSVIVVPGYGMAVAQAQHAVREITNLLATRSVKVRYAIHPVAGRLPGHMNVLLAEADVPYDIVKEMEEINEEFSDTDVVLVIGANDIVNPSAQTDTSSPIYGMPVLEVWKAARVVMLKRGMAAGYAGVENPLCYLDNTLMLFGDAKQSVQKLLESLRAG